MRNSLLAALAALTVAAPATAQAPSMSVEPLSMPAAPPGLGERITSGIATPYEATPRASLGVTHDQLHVRQHSQGGAKHGAAVSFTAIAY
jgi:hypothetical protein